VEHATDWLSLSLRWLHIIAGAAWIGTSFYFNWVNNTVRAPEKQEEGVGGELWSIHGGHVYRVVKYMVPPSKIPGTLHWFKWEAYTTWLSGFALLAVVYYLNPTTYLIDSTVKVIDPWVAVAIGVGTLTGGWLFYHYLCKSPLGRKPVPIGIIVFLFIGGIAYFLTQSFGSRAAYIHVGALIGTIMAANVFFVIIPKQHVMVEAMAEGKPDADASIDGAIRSRHNNYFTLPVLFIMVSNHYPFTFGHEWNWAILAGISIVGAVVRHWFNLRGMGQKNVWILPAGAIGMVALALVTIPKSYADFREVEFVEVRGIIEERCLPCHSETPTNEAFPTAPQGVMFDTPDQIGSLSPRINSVAVVSRTMPLGNMTNITEEEREVLGAWYFQGASTFVPETIQP